MIVTIILVISLIISLLIVIKAADLFVDNLVEIGLVFGISEIILGVTAAAIGTSLPEFGSAMLAILTGNPEVGIGCAIGANIWNIGGILGISTIFAGTILSQKEEIRRDGSMTLITALIITIFMFMFGELNLIVGIVLLSIYIIYIWILIRAQQNNVKNNKKSFVTTKKEKKKRLKKENVFWVITGLIGLAVGCRVIVYSTVTLAEIASIPEMLAGILLAFGTTAPEFFTVLTSARKGLNRLAVGTVLGSNIFNILIGLGVPSLFVVIPVEEIAIRFDGPAMIVLTFLLIVLLRRRMKLTRAEGVILLSSYIIYMGTRLYIMS
ncbi:MAG: calcium/sodium antiporter [Methanobacteriaceae archaeon]|nr:calcium/sodium antiporter [Methanobacteriaceae archaeon]